MKRLLSALLCLLLLGSGGCSINPSAQTPAAPVMPVAQASEEALSAPVRQEYEDTLFDASYVHSVDILMPDDGAWDNFIANCENEEYIACDIVIDGELYENAAFRAKGNSSMMRSRASGKYSFKVEFDHFRDGTFHGLDKLALNNLVVDNSCMRDYITYRMMSAFGVASPLCSYTMLTVNGEPWGFYLAVEIVEDAFLDRNFGPGHGALYKPDNTGGGGGGGMGRTNDTKLIYSDNDPDSYPNIFGSAKTDISRKDQYRLINSLEKINAGEDIPSAVDIERMLRYLVVHTYVCNGDSYTGSSAHNYYLYEENGLLSMIPWDYNEAFGDFGSSGAASVVNSPIDTPVSSGEMQDRPMVAWVFEDEAYTARYHELYSEFLTQIWDSGWLRSQIEQTQALIGPYVREDPRSYTTYDGFLTAVDALLMFFDLRTQSIRGQLDGTIPSTTAGQREDSSSLVDASALPSSRAGMGGPSGERPSRASGESSGESSGEQPAEASGEQNGSDEPAVSGPGSASE